MKGSKRIKAIPKCQAATAMAAPRLKGSVAQALARRGGATPRSALVSASTSRRCTGTTMQPDGWTGAEEAHTRDPVQSIDNTAGVREFCECHGSKIKQQPKPLFVFHHTPDLLCNPRFIQNLG
ncbi:hypothetical protein QLX08_000411 [Tetragonisca angustula]|uniref:Uncharacterized protein n=1 Tax=Tetragonisca angustula TaxID=166442 RepID=A0AAW1AJX4_9HYME